MTTESISYENARALEQAFSAEYPEITDTGVSYAIRLNTLQVNTPMPTGAVTQSLWYIAVRSGDVHRVQHYLRTERDT